VLLRATDPLAAGYWWKKLRAPVILNKVKNLLPQQNQGREWSEILHFVQNDRGGDSDFLRRSGLSPTKQ